MTEPAPASWIQRALLAILPRAAAEDMRRESQEWHVRCLGCDRARTVWELGGVRWKARSLGKRTRVRCRVCGGRRAAAVERVPRAEDPLRHS